MQLIPPGTGCCVVLDGDYQWFIVIGGRRGRMSLMFVELSREKVTGVNKKTKEKENKRKRKEKKQRSYGIISRNSSFNRL